MPKLAILITVAIVSVASMAGWTSVSLFAADSHVVVQADDLAWKPAPPSLPAGAQIAIVSGDPTKAEPYVIRFKFPSGYKIAAHTHPNDENVTVIAGTFHLGRGAKLDEAKGEAINPGGFVHLASGMQHYAWTTEETIIQSHSIGPSGITYVNPADDPRQQTQ